VYGSVLRWGLLTSTSDTGCRVGRCCCEPSGYAVRERTSRQAPITDNQFRQRCLQARTALIKGVDAPFCLADISPLRSNSKSFRGRFQIKRLAWTFTHTRNALSINQMWYYHFISLSSFLFLSYTHTHTHTHTRARARARAIILFDVLNMHH